jgi:hypothetical protein
MTTLTSEIMSTARNMSFQDIIGEAYQEQSAGKSRF